MATFDGHIVEALMKTPEINAMYPNANCSLSDGLNTNVIRVPNGPKFRLRCATGKRRRTRERKETGKYTSVVDLASARVNQQNTENSAGKISPVTAAIRREYKSRHGKRWMKNWPTLSGLGDIDAGNIDGSIHRWAKMKLSTTIAKTGSASPHQCANSLMRFAT
ncbi:hypothetical protein O5541_03585 [Escherichia coli]|nr:hypothetical protein [Escherichia coli]